MRASRVARRALDTVLKAQEQHSNLNAFTTRLPSNKDAVEQTHGSLTDTVDQLLVAVKDNISTADFPTTCASRGLQNYTSPYDATIISRIKQQNRSCIVVGKTNLDEFGMGSYSTHSAFGPVRAPSLPGTPDLSAGGSSGGSAVAVATYQCDVAIGTDTGGSVRLPAAYTGVFGFKPSYGLVSRWGVVAYANSLDTVGFFGKTGESLQRIFESCEAIDPKDPTCLSVSTRRRLASKGRSQANLKIGVPRQYNITSLSPEVRAAWLAILHALRERGHTIHPVSLPSTSSALSAYYILAPAEASSNLAKYDSVRYGSRPPTKTSSADSETESTSEQHFQAGEGGELFSRARGHGLGDEVRRRILLGSYTLSAAAKDSYFVQAQRVRRQVVNDFDAVFAQANPLREDSKGAQDGVDLLIAPTAPTQPPTLNEVSRMTAEEAYAGDVFTVPASLAGLPAVSIPVRSKVGQQIGMQVIGQYGDDSMVLEFASGNGKDIIRELDVNS